MRDAGLVPGSGIRAAAIALAALLGLAACGQPPLPARLAGLGRTHVVVGPRAVRMITSLHTSRVAPPAAAIADYGRDGELRVWLARYRDGGEARRELARMVEGLRRGGPPFSSPSYENGRWASFGPGGHHLFWAADASVYWLQGAPGAVRAAAAELPAPATGQWT